MTSTTFPKIDSHGHTLKPVIASVMNSTFSGHSGLGGSGGNKPTNPLIVLKRSLAHLEAGFHQWKATSSDETLVRIARFVPEKAILLDTVITINSLSMSGRIAFVPDLAIPGASADPLDSCLDIETSHVLNFAGHLILLEPKDSLSTILGKIKTIPSEYIRFEPSWDELEKKVRVDVIHLPNSKKNMNDAFYATIDWSSDGLKVVEQLFNRKVEYLPPEENETKLRMSEKISYPLMVWEIKNKQKGKSLNDINNAHKQGSDWDKTIQTIKDTTGLTDDEIKLEYMYMFSEVRKCTETSYKFDGIKNNTSFSRYIHISDFLQVEARGKTKESGVLISVVEDTDEMIKALKEFSDAYNYLKTLEHDEKNGPILKGIYTALTTSFPLCTIHLPDGLKLTQIIGTPDQLYIAGAVIEGFEKGQRGKIIPKNSQLTINSETIIVSQDTTIVPHHDNHNISQAMIHFMHPIESHTFLTTEGYKIKAKTMSLSEWGVHFDKKREELKIDPRELLTALSKYSQMHLKEMFFAQPLPPVNFKGGYGHQIKSLLPTI